MNILFSMMAIGFLDASLLCMYVAEPNSPILWAEGIFFLVSLLCLIYWHADVKATKTRKIRKSWETSEIEDPDIIKAYHKRCKTMFMIAGAVGVCFLLLFLNVMLQ